MKPPLEMVHRALETLDKDKKCAAIECDGACEKCDLAHDINESIDAADIALGELNRLKREIKQDEICSAAVERFGPKDQILKAIEELAELQRALARYSAKWMDTRACDDVHEEIADVEIMMTQLRLIFDADEIDDWKDAKLERLARMVGVNVEEETTSSASLRSAPSPEGEGSGNDDGEVRT